jgi:hypothetical protein
MSAGRQSRKRRRSRKSIEGWRRRYVGDLRHMQRCCTYGRLPAENGTYLASILADELNLPTPKQVAAQVMLTNVQREQNKLWSIPPIDMTAEQLAEQRREKDRKRKELARRKDNVQTRDAYLAAVRSKKPWLALGIKKSAYYKRKAKAQAKLALGSSRQLNGQGGLGSSRQLK